MCDFPAAQYLESVRTLMRYADKYHEYPEEYLMVVIQITRLRLRHQQLTNCKCWYKAVEDAGGIVDWNVVNHD
jgi:hypothetical protein